MFLENLANVSCDIRLRVDVVEIIVILKSEYKSSVSYKKILRADVVPPGIPLEIVVTSVIEGALGKISKKRNLARNIDLASLKPSRKQDLFFWQNKWNFFFRSTVHTS